MRAIHTVTGTYITPLGNTKPFVRDVIVDGFNVEDFNQLSWEETRVMQELSCMLGVEPDMITITEDWDDEIPCECTHTFCGLECTYED